MKFRKFISLVLLTFIVISILNPLIFIRKAEGGKTWRVPEDYPTVDAAIIAASENDVVLISDGLYDSFIIDKKLKIIGAGIDSTFIEGDVLIESDGVEISDLTINSSREFSLYVDANHCKIYKIYVFSVWEALIVRGNYNQILNCYIQSDNRDAIQVLMNNNLLENNIIISEGSYEGRNRGIYTSDEYGNIIQNNDISSEVCIHLSGGYNNTVNNNLLITKEAHGDNDIGVWIGGDYRKSNQNIITNNIIEAFDMGIEINGDFNKIHGNHIEKAWRGIYVKKSAFSSIKNNIFISTGGLSAIASENMDIINNTFSGSSGIDITGNNYNILYNTIDGIFYTGIELYKVTRSYIMGNIIKNCGIGIEIKEKSYFEKSSNITICKNNFINNEINAIDDSYSSNVWYVNKTGNYYSDWITPDLNDDEIVDNPYIILGDARNIDRYPLTKPYEPRAEFKLYDLKIEPNIVELNKLFVVSVKLVNQGQIKGTYNIEIIIEGVDGIFRQSIKRTLSEGASKLVKLESRKEFLGTYIVKVNGLSDTFEVVKILTQISCKISNQEITIGDSISVSGKIKPQVITKNIFFTYTKPDGSKLSEHTVTDSEGYYSTPFTPTEVGLWSVEAYWDGDGPFKGSTSQSISFEVVEKTGNLKVLVKDENENIINDAYVSSTSQPSGQSVISGTSSSDGSVTFYDINIGEYMIQASKKGYSMNTKKILVEVDETTTINLEKIGPEIPGFPNESILLGLVVGFLLFWLLQKE